MKGELGEYECLGDGTGMTLERLAGTEVKAGVLNKAFRLCLEGMGNPGKVVSGRKP